MFNEDLTPFFNSDELADKATLNGAEVIGVMEPGYQSASLDGFGVAAGSSPTFTLASASVPAQPEGKSLVVSTGPAAGTYRIANARHDGTGVCILDLLN